MDEAVLKYEQYQGLLTRESTFGRDPLSSRMDLMRRREQCFTPSFEDIFSDIVSSNGELFVEAMREFGQLTERFVDFL